jgi:hypothetical protein
MVLAADDRPWHVRTVFLSSEDLAPPAWSGGDPQSCLVFNAAVVRFKNRLLLAYRVAPRDRRRRIAVCALDPQSLTARRETVVPLSDYIPEGSHWQGDPRFFVFNERLFLHYNTGEVSLPNQIYLVELDADDLRPISRARSLELDGPRQPSEKNWLLFEHDGRVHAVYYPAPQIILTVDWKSGGALSCRRAFRTDWDASSYISKYGTPHGGAPPVRIGDRYSAFFNSSFRMRTPSGGHSPEIHGSEEQTPAGTIRYVSGYYEFAAEPPFAPLRFIPRPVLTPVPYLRPGHSDPLCADFEGVVYTSGAVRQNGHWLVSHGLFHRHCCLSILRHEDLVAACEDTGPLAPGASKIGEDS